MEKEKNEPKEPNKIISISELSLELGVYKSRIDYYWRQGLITPMETIGRTKFFDKQKTILRLKEIEKLQKKGLSLKEIAEILKEE